MRQRIWDRPHRRSLATEIGIFVTIVLGLLALPERFQLLLIPVLLGGAPYFILRLQNFERQSAATPLPIYDVFQPWVSVDDLLVWPRDYHLTRLWKSVDRSAISVVTGKSGSGKSTLLRRLFIVDAAHPDRDILRLYVYTSQTVADLISHVSSSTRSLPPIIVLDQFERYLTRSVDLAPDAATGGRTRLLQLVNQAIAVGCRIVIGIRSEWLSELTFLGDLLPPLGDVVNLEERIAPDEQTATYAAIETALSKLVDIESELPKTLLEQIAPAQVIHPLEVQIVGAELEILASKQGLTSSSLENELGGRFGAIDHHFSSIVRGTGDEDLSRRCLYVLAVRNVRALPLSQRELCAVLQEPDRRVSRVISALQQSLVSVGRDGGVALRHDYWATYFDTTSGDRTNREMRGHDALDPRERDNLRMRASGTPRVRLSPVLRDPEAIESCRRTGSIVFAVLTALTLIRTVGFGFDWTHWSVIRSVYVYRKTIDLSYLPIAPAHIVWTFYVGNTFDHEYRHLAEPGFQRALSYGVLFNMAASLIVCYFFPEYWALAVGWGGLVLGIKMYLIGSLNVSESGRSEFRRGGRLTIINALVAMLAGAILAASSRAATTHGVGRWETYSWLVSLVLTYVGIELTRRHVTRRASRQWLGLLGR